MLGPAPRRPLLPAAAIASACAANAPIQMPEGRTVPACASEGRRACEQACARADAHACRAAAIAHGESDREAMMQYERKACELGVALSCFVYASDFDTETEPGLVAAIEYDAKACDAEAGVACLRLGRNRLVADARGIVEDAGEAIAAWDTGCELGERTACLLAADARALGLGTAADPEAATAAYAQACEDRDATACHNAEHGATELWLTLAEDLVLEPVFTGAVQGV